MTNPFEDPKIISRFQEKFIEHFTNYYRYLESKEFFGVNLKFLLNEKYFQMIFMNAANLSGMQIELIMPEVPYPVDTSKHMDIFMHDNNNIEIKYLKASKTNQKLTDERGKLFADFCKLVKYSDVGSNLFQFLIIDEQIRNHFKNFKLITQDNFFISEMEIIPERLNKTEKRYINIEIGKIDFEFIKLKLDCILQFELKMFGLFLLKIREFIIG